ncbi:MAG: four helix bundle protein [Chlamydiae bacterium]|nr:four helix bundle protein [Chlamydiota bacterium]
MTTQNLKLEKEKFKSEFKNRIKIYILKLITHIEGLPQTKIYQIVSNQLLRSGTSIGANYFEARAASSKNDFINFFTHALKSANESKFWLEILTEVNHNNVKETKFLLKEVVEIANVLASSILKPVEQV